jgi:hypothetical protein
VQDNTAVNINHVKFRLGWVRFNALRILPEAGPGLQQNAGFLRGREN